jgi:hypothetical protein
MLPQMAYPEGTFGSYGKHFQILDAYMEQRQLLAAGVLSADEAMSVSDFPTYINNFVRHSFQARREEVRGKQDQWTQPREVQDFLPYSFSRWGRLPNIPRKPLNGPYARLHFKELPGGSYQIVEWGAEVDLTRQLIISDRTNEFAQIPAMMGEAEARTESTEAVTVLESNPTMWDGNALFSVAHANIATTALTADITGANLILTAINAIANQRDAEGYRVNNPTQPLVLLVPQALEQVATDLMTRENLPLDATNAASLLRPNPVRGRATVIVEWFLTDTNNWYLLVQPTGQNGAIAALNLLGVTTPFVGLKAPETRALFGGDDPYSFAFEELSYKIRHDFEYVAFEWTSAYGGIVA